MKVSVESVEPEAKRREWKYIVAAGTAGLVMATTFPGYNQWYLAWIGLVPLMLALRSASPGEGFRRAYLAGFVFNGFILSWLLGLVYWAGAIVLLGISLMVAYLAVYWGVFGWTYCKLRSFGKWHPVVFGPLVWVILEYLQSKLFTGFGWGLVGHTQIRDLSLSQCAAFGGVFLVSAIVVAVNICLASVIEMRKSAKWISLAAAVALFIVPHLAGTARLGVTRDSAQILHVAIIQGAFPIATMYNSEHDEYVMAIQKTRSEFMAERGANLIVWPESAITGNHVNPEYGYGAETKDLADSIDVYLMAGGMRQERTDTLEVFNSAFLFGPDGEPAAAYDKVHLTPFGEYIPFKKFLPFLGKIVLSIFDITPGEELMVFNIDEAKCGPLICFETVFPELSRRLVDRGAQCLVSMSNLAWFGMSAAPQQEFAISRFRAIENGVPLIRCANTGISGVVDSKGRVVRKSQQGIRTSFDIEVEIPPEDAPNTFYTRHGNLFILLSAVVLAVAVILRFRKEAV